jgi:hypothetical protein
MINIIGRTLRRVFSTDVAISAPPHAGKDPEYFMSNVLLLDGDEHVLLKTDDIVPFRLGISQLVPADVDGEDEYRVTGRIFTGIYTTESGQLFLQLDSGTFVTVNDNDGYYLDLYSAEDISLTQADDPSWALRRVL